MVGSKAAVARPEFQSSLDSIRFLLLLLAMRFGKVNYPLLKRDHLEMPVAQDELLSVMRAQ